MSPADDRFRISSGRFVGLAPEVPLVALVSNFPPGEGPRTIFVEMAWLDCSVSAATPTRQIAGDGPSRQHIESHVRAVGLQKQGHNPPVSAQIFQEVLRALDVFVYPSHSEGISNASPLSHYLLDVPLSQPAAMANP